MVAETKPDQFFNKNASPDNNGPLSGGVCVWLVKREGNKTYLLFQKRSTNVQNAGLYDSSSGGHIDKGEDALTAALRETKEEIGLNLVPEDLKFVCSYATTKKLMHVYLSDRTGKNDQLNIDKYEVDGVEWVSFEDLDDFVKTKVKSSLTKFFPHIKVLRFYIENFLYGDY